VRVERAVGIKQVAEQAGVSITTVSHALNDKGRLSEETRRRVAEVAERLGYRPNTTARNLAGGRSGMIGLAVAQTAQNSFALSDFAYFSQLMSAASLEALDRGYALVLAAGARGGAWSRMQVDGAIIVDPIADDPLLETLQEEDVPLVTTGRVPGEEEGCWVDNDHWAGTRAVLDHLAARGAQRIALMTSPPVTSYAIHSQQAYEEWCAEHGQEAMVSVAHGDLTERSGFDAAIKLLRRTRPPDAVHSTLDRLSLGTLLAAKAQGLAVPRELLVTGCTDSEAGKGSRPGLTALALNPERIGRTAVDMVTALIEGEEPPSRQVLVPTRILPRGSTRRRVVAPAAA
jgi:DNA-binding LacI/PurR family transcriptional regulator